MDREKLKVIITQMETLLDVLKSEVYSDPSSYYNNEEHIPILDYDEIYDDDDGYPD